MNSVAERWSEVSLRDRFTILALVISSLLALDKGDSLMVLAVQIWRQEGIIVICAKFLAFCGLFASAFAVVVQSWMKAVSFTDTDYKAKVLAVLQSLLILCGAWVALEYLGNKRGFDVPEFLILWVKSTVAAIAWVLGCYACYNSVLLVEKTLSFESLWALAAVVLLVCYSACLLSYVKQDWMLDMAFVLYWMKLVALAEIPVASVAAACSYKMHVDEWAAGFARRDMNEKTASSIVTVGLCAGIMHFSATLSAAACKPQDACGFICGCKLEVAGLCFTCGCVLTHAFLQNLSQLDMDHNVKQVLSAAALLLMVAMIVIAHGNEIPGWSLQLLDNRPFKLTSAVD